MAESATKTPAEPRKQRDTDPVLDALAGTQAEVDRRAAEGGASVYSLADVSAAASTLGADGLLLAGLFHYVRRHAGRTNLTADEIDQALRAYGKRGVA